MVGLRGELGAEATGKYRIVMPLGQGGTSEVYLAVADGPGGFYKLVVLKVLKKALARDHEFRTMFLGEARLAARLHHPNIVQTNEILELPGGPVMVMEYLEGQSLSQVIVRGRGAGFTLAMQLRVLIDALSGLHAAHELMDFDGTPLGVVHRDVSPHNLFVTAEGQAKVLDFGIAKLERSLIETEVGTIKGKIRYMAPEQLAGEKVDRRADIYAAGVILWEALAGERMWKVGTSEAEIRARVLAGDLPVSEAAARGAPASLLRVCRRALARNPAERHATALELADELEAARAELSETTSHRELGATVTRLFGGERVETRAAIERALTGRPTGVESGTFEGAEPDSTVSTVVIEAPWARAAQLSTPLPRQRQLARAGLLAGGAAIALLAAAAVWRAGSGPRKGAPAPPVPAAATVVGEKSSPVHPPAPVAAAAPPASSTTTALTSRDGRSPAKGPSKRPAKAHAAAEPTVGRAPAPLDCDHPFFVDGQGIKRFRPECM